MSIWIVLIFGIIIFSFFLLRKHKHKEAGKSVQKEEVKESPETKYLIILKDLNLRIRTDDFFDVEIRDKVEKIIDILWDILPKVNNMDASSEISWVINKISKEYLVELIGNYQKLDKDGREKLKVETVSGLEALEGEITGVKELLSSQDEMKLKSTATHLKTKFFKG